MDKRFYNFIVVFFMFFLVNHAFCQQKRFLTPEIHIAGPISSLQYGLTSLPVHLLSATLPRPAIDNNNALMPVSQGHIYTQHIISQDHYTQNLAFFCRQEYKFEKTTRIPLRFRVGSVEQCNQLEGK